MPKPMVYRQVTYSLVSEYSTREFHEPDQQSSGIIDVPVKLHLHKAARTAPATRHAINATQHARPRDDDSLVAYLSTLFCPS
jgi:hypothetical protein